VRHATCFKNIERRHGGQGSSLTEVGKAAAQHLAESLSKRDVSPSDIFYVDRKQCFETAEILASVMDNPLLSPLPCEPFYLGVLAGLSEDECAEQYPDLAKKMARYRRGEIDISEVEIPGASDPVAFAASARRTLTFLQAKLATADVLIVGTRSVLVGLMNIALLRSPVPGGGYREIPWMNCGWCRLSQSLQLEEGDGVSV
jgi:broad specificity phosphatase PhoE